MVAAAVLGFMLAKLLSPGIIVLSLITGWFARTWWQVLVAAVLVAVLDEMVLHSMQQTRRFSPEVFLIAVAAAAIWGFAVFAFRRRRTRQA